MVAALQQRPGKKVSRASETEGAPGQAPDNEEHQGKCVVFKWLLAMLSEGCGERESQRGRQGHRMEGTIIKCYKALVLSCQSREAPKA